MSEASRPRRTELRRIGRLFTPYRVPLGAVLALIALSAGISLISPFLLRAVLDDAIPNGDTTQLTWLVLGMIAVAISTGALGVAQTYLSNVVGQEVMHDLRAAVYRHLQRLSLAFFTRTRTGEVQSRIASDIGGIQSVVTSTATSIVANVTTVLATIIAMFALDWRLAAFSLVVLPFFVWMTRRVGGERRKITAARQGRVADMSSLVEESLSVSGILLGRTMGRGEELVERFSAESRELATLEVRSRMAGRWRMASVQMSFAIMPALVYWFAGQTSAISVGTLVAFTTLQTRLLFPIGSLLSVSVDLQSSMALFHRIFEYLDLPIDLAEAEHPVALDDVRGDVRFEGVTFGYDADARPTLDGVDLEVAPGSFTAIVGETGSGKTTLAYLAARLYDVNSGRVTIDGVDVRDVSFASLARTVGLVSQDTYLFHASVRDNLRFARPDATDEELEAAARAAQIHDLIAACPTATRRWSASAATASAAARSSASRSRASSCATRRCSSSTRRRARWTTRPSGRCRTRWTTSRPAGRRSRSPTGCRPCATPTRSSCSTAAGSSSAGRTRSCWSWAGATARCSAPRARARAGRRRRRERRRAPRPRLVGLEVRADAAGLARRGLRGRRRPAAAGSGRPTWC